MTGDRFVSPRADWVGGMQNRLANARWLRGLLRSTIGRLPFPVLASDVRDVIYATWAVPVARALPFVLAGVDLAERDGLTLLTVLSYRHGHFGPVAAGPLRRLLPSPLQSNWRLYVARLDGAPPSGPTVLFVRNVFDSALYALGTRLGSDALPSHQAAQFHLKADATGCAVTLAKGGSAPGLALSASRATARTLPTFLRPFFPDWSEAVATLANQDAALAAVPGRAMLAHARIDLPVELGEVQPLDVRGYRPGALLVELGAVAPPFCFFLPRVAFRVLSEELLHLRTTLAPAAAAG